MKYTIDERMPNTLTASTKARDDVTNTLVSLGYKSVIVECDYTRSTLYSVKTAFSETHRILKILKRYKSGDIVFFQHPYVCYTNYLGKHIQNICRKKNIKTCILIHDLDSLRYAEYRGVKKGAFFKKVFRDEIKYLDRFDSIIAHNSSMKEQMVVAGIQSDKIYELEVFDYLLKNDQLFELDEKSLQSKFKSIIIAGNLTKYKSEYIYHLSDLKNGEYHFELFGINYEGPNNNFIHYNGAFKPEELPQYINFGFGLVWDGTSILTCDGSVGEYIKYNNPHKLSLYIACNIPVIVWDKSAVAKFIKKEKIGIVVGSLKDVQNVLENMDFSDYLEMKTNVSRVRKSLIKGDCLKACIEEIEGKY